MAPQPKRKLSSGRRDRRRAHDALEARNHRPMQQLRRDATSASRLSKLRSLQRPRSGQRRKEIS